MKPIDSGADRSAGCGNLSGEALERHLFVCTDCRDRVRLSAAWEALRGSADVSPVSEAFLARALRARRRDLSRRRRGRILLAAAAVLLFFFAAGANSRSRPAPAPTAESAYSGLTTPSTLDGLLPE